MTHPNDDNSLDGSQICILWHAAERSPAASLIAALTKRGMRVTTTSSMHSRVWDSMPMRQICQAGRDRA